MVNWKQFLSDENLERKMIKVIEEEGAIKTSDNKWVLDTKFGKLRIFFDLDYLPVPAIFMKFEEPKRSKHLYGVNKFSGKWNIHEHEIKDIYKEFRLRIDEVKLTPIEKTTRKYNL